MNQQAVQVGEILTVNAVLEVGAVSNVVEVTRDGRAPNYRPSTPPSVRLSPETP